MLIQQVHQNQRVHLQSLPKRSKDSNVASPVGWSQPVTQMEPLHKMGVKHHAKREGVRGSKSTSDKALWQPNSMPKSITKQLENTWVNTWVLPNIGVVQCVLVAVRPRLSLLPPPPQTTGCLRQALNQIDMSIGCSQTQDF